jgi:hypothetical protein
MHIATVIVAAIIGMTTASPAMEMERSLQRRAPYCPDPSIPQGGCATDYNEYCHCYPCDLNCPHAPCYPHCVSDSLLCTYKLLRY